MRTAALRELRTNVDKYISLVKKGEEVLITDHGKPVARLSQPSSEDKTLEERLAPLIAEGWVHPPTKKNKAPHGRPIVAKGKPASEMVIEDRR